MKNMRNSKVMRTIRRATRSMKSSKEKKLSGRQFSNVLSCKSDPAAELIEPRAKLQGLKSPPHEFIPNTLLKGVRTPPNAQKFT